MRNLQRLLGSLIVGLLSVRVSGLCPGDTPCSGHGTCGSWDLCTCHRNWKGYDCSIRVCPFGRAWADIGDNDNLIPEHHYAECSGKGECNPDSGLCACYDGFEGSACQRMACPDDCSGHGTCALMSRVNPSYTGWDKDKIQICRCDPGWTGVACDLRMCKPGDDPLTLHSWDGTIYQRNEVQRISFSGGGAYALTGYFTLSFTDWRGKTWTTHPLNIATASEISVAEALQALPNQAIPEVLVTKSTTAASSGAVYFDITFTSPTNSGDVSTLVINYLGCEVDGCQPVYAPIVVAAGGTRTIGTSTSTPGTEESLECSQRGECNTGTGLCACFKGYYGEACELQTIIT